MGSTLGNVLILALGAVCGSVLAYVCFFRPHFWLSGSARRIRVDGSDKDLNDDQFILQCRLAGSAALVMAAICAYGIFVNVK